MNMHDLNDQMTEIKEIYLDNSATTPLSPAAREAALEAMGCYGNPSSLHTRGQSAKKLLEASREAILSCLGVRPRQGELIFTGSGSEATSLAILGTAHAKARREANVLVTTDSEHPATLRVMESLEAEGFELVKLPTRGGVIDTAPLDALLSDRSKKVFLASLMLVNNETGAVYDVKSVFAKIKAVCPDAICHVDAIQGFMRLPFTPASLGAQLISVSGHKIHAPKGVGALYVDPALLRAKKLVPIIRGGGQEGGLRSGTENIIGISAFAAAARDIAGEKEAVAKRLSELYSYAEERLSELELTINTPHGARVDHIMNITLPSIKSETMLHFLSAKGICVSSGSACSSHSPKPSHALLAFGLDPRAVDCSLRVSFSRYNTKEDIDALTDALSQGIASLVRIKR